MGCLTCNDDCTTIPNLLPINDCIDTNSSKPTGFYLSSYPLPSLSADPLYDPAVPVDATNFTTDFLARLDNTDETSNDVIRCFCAKGTLGEIDLPETEQCGNTYYGSGILDVTFTTVDFSTKTLAFLQNISNCNKSVYLYFRTDDLLLGAYKSDTKCFEAIKATIRMSTPFDGGDGEVNLINLKIKTERIKGLSIWKQENISALDLSANCDTYN